MRIRAALAAGLAVWIVMAGVPAFAASPLADSAAKLLTPAKAEVSKDSEDDPAQLRQLLQKARDDAQHAADPKPPAGATREEVLDQVNLLAELSGALERHLDVLDRLPEAGQRLSDQEARTRDWSSFDTPPPYSILLVDKLREAVTSARIQADAAVTRGSLADQQAEEYANRMQAAEIVVRQSEEAAGQARTPEQRDRQIWLRDLARLRARAAAAVIAESHAEKRLTGIEAAEQRSLTALLERQLEVAGKAARFTQSDLDSVLADLDRQHAALEKRSAQLKSQGLQSRQALAEANRMLAVAKADAPRPSRISLLERLVALRRLQADNDELAYDVARRTIELRDWERVGWQYRWLLFNSGEREKLSDALTNLAGLMDRLQSWNQYIQGETLRADQNGDDIGARSSGDGSAEERALAADYRTARQQRAEILRGFERAVGNLLRMLGQWRQDILLKFDTRSTSAIVGDWWSAARQAVNAVWSFELFAAEDNLEIDGQRVTAVRSVTVGKTLGVILLVVLGAVVTNRALKGLKHLAVKRLGVSRNRMETVVRWSHIVLVSMLVLTALYLANIPLTVFAFLGGALAIGVGFGTQVTLKNLIAGIMLLVERPLRVGDIVEVGSVVGTVTNISIRSSTVRTSDGIEILVPNASFIENNVTNWTYSNPQVRRSVTVGADSAAPPREVSAVLLGVATRHPALLKDPPPRVLLSELDCEGKNHFTLRYWIDYGAGVDASQIASDLRIMVAEALAEAGFAFPARNESSSSRQPKEPACDAL